MKSSLLFLLTASALTITLTGCGKSLGSTKNDGVVYCTISKGNIRETPGGKALKSVTAHFGTRLELLEKKPQKSGKYQWYHVQLENGTKGWVSTSIVNDIALAGAVIDSARLTKKYDDLPETGKKVKGLTICIVTGEKNGRYFVTTEKGKTGWVFKDALATKNNDLECARILSYALNSKKTAKENLLRSISADTLFAGSQFLELIPDSLKTDVVDTTTAVSEAEEAMEDDNSSSQQEPYIEEPSEDLSSTEQEEPVSN